MSNENNNNIQIRETSSSDFNHIMEVEKQAFGYDKEAKLVADLLTDITAEPVVSFLAFHNEEAVGHILFTRAYFSQQQDQPMMHILAPLAIPPPISKARHRWNADKGRHSKIKGERLEPYVRIGA